MSPYGALDMAGNVWDWVNDWYDEGYYETSPGSNPTGPESGPLRALRGGGWSFTWHFVRVANRHGNAPRDSGVALKRQRRTDAAE
jgi:formylglycine-generating enzyme required for sulfatase activity